MNNIRMLKTTCVCIIKILYIYISIWIQFLPEKVHHKIILQRLYQKALGRSLSLSLYVCMYVYIYIYVLYLGTLWHTTIHPKIQWFKHTVPYWECKTLGKSPTFQDTERIHIKLGSYIYISHYIPLHQLYIYVHPYIYIYIYPIIFHYVTIVGWESSSWYPHCWGKSQLCTHPM